METKKTAAILAGCLLAAAGLFLLLDSGPDQDTPISESIDSDTVSAAGASADRSDQFLETRTPNPTTPVDSAITKEQFEQLSPEEQNKVMEEFAAGFWQSELRGLPGAIPEQKYISLDVFSRPYMHTIKETEFAQLSPEDREKAISEVMLNCQEYRAHIWSVVAEAKAAVGNSDYQRAEALLISGLERGRGLSADKEGLLITRLAGIACQKISLKEMEQLYAKTGDRSKAGMVQGRLQGIDAEVQEIKDSVQAVESGR